MTEKFVNASQARLGANIVVEGVPCTVKSNDISKTGKHGHAKCRIEAVSIIDGKKKVFVAGGHDRLEVPIIEKKRGQILSFSSDKASIMDLESFETLELAIPEELKTELKEQDQVEYWIVNDSRIIKRKA
jgi:translation initiation factor 5A